MPAQDAAIHTAGDVVIAKGAGRFEAIIDLPGEGTIGRDLVVRSAAAASSVLVRNADVIRHLSVVTGQGVDDVTVVDSHVRENLVVVTAAGRDTVALGTTQVAGDTRIEAGAGNDTVELRHVNARTRLFALMGAGDDALTLVNVLLSAAPGRRVARRRPPRAGLAPAGDAPRQRAPEPRGFRDGDERVKIARSMALRQRSPG